MGTDIKAHIAAQQPVKPLGKKALGSIIDEVFKQSALTDTSLMLDKLKDQGFKYSTIAGITVSAYDIQVPQAKFEIFDKADQKLEQIKTFYNKIKLTEAERYQSVIKLWTVLKMKSKKSFVKSSKLMIVTQSSSCPDSGARGSLSNFTQLVGMCGLMSNPKRGNNRVTNEVCLP